MYSMLFHISGIAILEICFFFYYIGPMETFIFEDKVKQLSNEPISSSPDLNILDDDRYSIFNQTDIAFDELRSDRDDAIDEREVHSYQPIRLILHPFGSKHAVEHMIFLSI